MIQKYFEVICDGCNTKFVVPEELHKAALKSSDVSFWCPYGHKLCFDEKSRQKEIEDKLDENKKPNLRLVVNNEVE